MVNRIVFIDIAKALCIILVVVGHYTPDGCPSWWMYIHDIIYSFHMPLFMFASGFVYIATKRDNQIYLDFLIKKIERLMIPYFIVSALIISIKLLTEGQMYVQNPKTIMSFVKMFYLPEAGYFLWFIWALWWMFVIVPLFRTPKQRLLLFTASILLHYLPFATTEVFCIAQLKNMLVYFMFGVIVYDWKTYFTKFKMISELIYIILFLVVSNVSLFIGVNIFVPYFGIAAIITFSQMIEKSSIEKRWLMVTSASSYIIYLFHTTFEGLAKAIVLKLPFFKDVSNDFTFALGAVFVVGCGVIIPIVLNEMVFKKYAITRVLFGLK